MKQTGELLRQARENAKLSLSEVALSTKINPKILAAIENGDTANLPAKTFLKGFVRSYALFLKMDADEVMKVFHSETGGTPPPVIDKEVIRQAHEAAAPEKPAAAPKQRRVGDDESFSGLRAIAVTVIVILIGVIIGVRELVEKYQREKVVDAAAELKVSPLETPKDEAKKEEARKEEVKAEQKLAAEQTNKVLAKLSEIKIPVVEAKKEEPKKEEPKKEVAEVKPPAPAPAPAPEVKPPPAPVAEVKAPPPAPTPAPPPPPAPVATAPAAAPAAAPATAPKPESILKSVKNEIILEALDKVEVKFKVKGQAKILSLGPTQVHTIFADEPMVLDLSDGGAVNIILNGRERGVPGDLGKPKQVTIP